MLDTTQTVEALLCPCCGQQERCSIFEMWSDHSFMLDTCCEGAHEEAVWFMTHEPEAAAAWLRGLGVEAQAGGELRRLAGFDDGRILLDYKPVDQRVTFAVARAFVARHHEHAAPPWGWKFGTGLRNGTTLIGVVVVGRPVARAYEGRGILEVTRLCARRDISADLRRNACSRLYGWAAREARARGFRRLITYTRADEHGGTLKAAGFVCEGRAGGRSWNTPGKPRVDRCAIVPRLRWARQLAA